MASFTAAGTSYSNYNVITIPFFTYYSMFGFQRIGDLVWAFADTRGRGFLIGATAGRTTLLGEGLQHQDGHSHVLASTVPTCHGYDPAYMYEIAVIVQDGIRRMYELNEDRFYYITVYNEDYPMPEMPKGCEEGILRGIYKYRAATNGKAIVQLFGSGPILSEALRAQEILAEKYGVNADVWSVTSYNELRRDALSAERWNRLHPAQAEKKPYILTAIEGSEGPIIAATDYMKVVPDQLSPWLRERLEAQPGIEAVSYADTVPQGFDCCSWEPVKVQGYLPDPGENMNIDRNIIAPGYFRLLGIPLLEGAILRRRIRKRPNR